MSQRQTDGRTDERTTYHNITEHHAVISRCNILKLSVRNQIQMG